MWITRVLLLVCGLSGTLGQFGRSLGSAGNAAVCQYGDSFFSSGDTVYMTEVCLETVCEDGQLKEIYKQGPCSSSSTLSRGSRPGSRAGGSRLGSTNRVTISQPSGPLLGTNGASVGRQAPVAGSGNQAISIGGGTQFAGSGRRFDDRGNLIAGGGTRFTGGGTMFTGGGTRFTGGGTRFTGGGTRFIGSNNQVTEEIDPLQQTAFTCADKQPGLYPLPEDPCGAYVQCNANVRFSCPDDLSWDDEFKVCDFPRNVKCDGSGGRRGIGRSTGFTCNGLDPMNVGTFFSDPSSCSSYHVCTSDGVFLCPPGTSFNAQAQECDRSQCRDNFRG